MPSAEYVHGYSEPEAARLRDQANTLSDLLHHDTVFPDGSRVLEAGCGVGAQTAIIASKNPGARFTAVDVSAASLEENRKNLADLGLTNVVLQQADILSLPFSTNSFDHVFVCFVLEHLPEPLQALAELKRLLRPGGTITVIEGDHGSSLFSPASEHAWKNIQGLITAQKRLGGNALIGRTLYPLLQQAGFKDATVSPRQVYADASRPDWVDGFTRKTFIAMVQGVRQQVLDSGFMEAAEWERGIGDLDRTAGPEGVFCYTFFKARARA